MGTIMEMETTGAEIIIMEAGIMGTGTITEVETTGAEIIMEAGIMEVKVF